MQTIEIKELDLDSINPSTDNYTNPEQGGSKIVVCGKPGCFALNTEIMMYDGSVKLVQNVLPGDRVMGWDSNERNVLELCRNSEEMFDVMLEDGTTHTVNRNHILTLKNSENGSIIDITVNDFVNKPPNFQHKYRWFRTSVNFASPEKSYYSRIAFVKSYLDTNAMFLYSENRYRLHAISEIARSNIRSLGYKVYSDDRYVYVDGDIFELFSYNIPYKERQNSYRFSLVSKGLGNYYGFTLDGDHRFLLSDYSVVHNTGKSYIIASILYAKKHIFPVGMVMSGTEDSNHFYEKIMPESFIFNNYDEEQVKKFIRRQRLAKEHLENPWAILILDDCTDDPKIFNKQLQQAIYKNGRHWKMLYILSLQYGLDIKPVIRTNVDGTFILRETNLRNRETLWKNYAGIIPDFDLFCQIMDQITNDYTALYIRNDNNKSNKWQDNVFWYKAKPIPEDFKFGCDLFWEHHDNRFNKEYVAPIL